MSLLSFPKMIFVSDEGWPEIERTHPPLLNFFTTFVLPMALLPPALLYYAGSRHGNLLASGFGEKPWLEIAIIFFLTEMVTVLLMGWMIRQMAEVYRFPVSAHDAFMLAGIIPIPLWLSSLSLLVPNLAFDAGIALLALAASCGLLYHGMQSLCHVRDEITAEGITQTVMGAGLVIWAVLLAMIVAL